MIEAVGIYEMSVIIYQPTWQNMPQDNHLQPECPFNTDTHSGIVPKYKASLDWAAGDLVVIVRTVCCCGINLHSVIG